MSREGGHGWTVGAPKWAAVIVLGAAAVGAIGWAMGRGGVAAVKNAPPVAVLGAARADSPSAAGESKKDATGAVSIGKLVNLNTATEAELELLPGVGPSLAKRIVEHRVAKGPFKRVEDLDAVKGLGPRAVERVRKLVTVE